MSKIPDPFKTETKTLFENENMKTKTKIHSSLSTLTLKDKHRLKGSIINLQIRCAKEEDIYNL